jgi:hypothetical protein
VRAATARRGVPVAILALNLFFFEARIVARDTAAVCSDIGDAGPLQKFPRTFLLIPKQVFLALHQRVEAINHLPRVKRCVRRVRLEIMVAIRANSMRRHH